MNFLFQASCVRSGAEDILDVLNCEVVLQLDWHDGYLT